MSIVFLVLCVVSLLGWMLHTRRLRADLDAAIADRDALSAELDQAYLAGAALADHDQRSSRRAGRQFMRSFKRRRAIVRIARAHRRLRAENAALRVELCAISSDRNDVIEAMTCRIAELMPCHDRIAFVDGELSEERSAAYRAHLSGCAACRQALPEDVAIMAQLGDQR